VRGEEYGVESLVVDHDSREEMVQYITLNVSVSTAWISLKRVKRLVNDPIEQCPI
jgi:hypothetical protein